MEICGLSRIIFTYDTPVIFPSILTILPTPFFEKHAKTIRDPLPYFVVFTIFFDLRRSFRKHRILLVRLVFLN